MAADAVPDLDGQVQPPSVVFQPFHHPRALFVMPEPSLHDSVESPLPRMAERGVPQIVAQGDRLGQILIQAQRPRDGTGDLGYLEGMGQAGTVMIPFGRQENLRFVLETAERFRMQDAIPVPLISGPIGAGFLFPVPALGTGRQSSAGRQHDPFDFLLAFPCRHGSSSFLIPFCPPSRDRTASISTIRRQRRFFLPDRPSFFPFRVFPRFSTIFFDIKADQTGKMPRLPAPPQGVRRFFR